MNLNVGRPVTGAELVGRAKEIKEILQTLKAGQSVVLIAPRRFGKTSIMMEVLNRLRKDNYYTGGIDIFTIPNLEQLAFEITSQVLKNRKLDESLNKLKNNIGEILTNIKFRNEIQDAEVLIYENLHRGVKIYFGIYSYEPETKRRGIKVYYDSTFRKIATANL